MSSTENGHVQVAPAVYIFSSWVENLAIRFRMLNGKDIPGSLDSWTALLTWAASAEGKFEQAGRAFEMAAARQARDADRLLRQWQCDDEKIWLDERFFAIRNSAHRAFESQDFFSAEDWVEDLIEHLSKGDQIPVTLPSQIDLVGFVEETLQESSLLDTLEQRGVVVKRTENSSGNSRIRVFKYPAPEDEWQAAASWAKSRLDAGARRLAIVLPSDKTTSAPSARRIRDLLSAIFHPGEGARLEDSALQDFHIPDAFSLGSSGVVKDALLLLRMSLARSDTLFEFSLLSSWLLSHHWANSESESGARAQLELKLRDLGIYQLSLEGIRRLACDDGRETALAALIAKVSGLPVMESTAEAGSCFFQALKHWGWPGENFCNTRSREIDQFMNLLERLDTMSLGSQQTALDTLEMMAAGTRLSFGGGPLSPVQIVSPEVAAANSYEAVWVCGMDEASWPPPVSGNPFLPTTAKARIPRMNPEGQYAYYQALTERLCGSGEEVFLSWSEDGGQGSRRRSGLISAFDSKNGELVPLTSLAGACWTVNGFPIEPGNDHLVADPDGAPGLPVSAAGGTRLPGGAGFFRLQAACPMLGYLRYRLAADFPSPPSALANPMFRGELMHQALRELYRQAVISGKKPDSDEVPASVEAAMIRLRARQRLTASGYLAERKRLANLLYEWLQLDNTREGFRVEAIEEGRRLESGNSEINIRFDRLDRLSDQTFLVLDYKSGGGKSRALKWTLPRLQEPQLPLYAVLLEEEGKTGQAGGISFAIVSKGQCGFDGITGATEDESTRGIRQTGVYPLRDWDWPSLMAHWRSQIGMLREEILGGRADNCIYDRTIVEQSGLELILRYAKPGSDEADEGTNAS